MGQNWAEKEKRLVRLQVLIILWQGSILCFFDVLLDLLLPLGVHGHLWGHKGGHCDKLKVGVSNQLPCEPQERLLEIVVGLGRYVVILKVLLAMEDDGLGLDLPVLDVHLVPRQHNGDVLTNSDQVSVPVGNILVGYSRCHVEHDDCTLALDVVTIPQTPKLLLTSCVPHIEPDSTTVGVEDQRVNLHSKC